MWKLNRQYLLAVMMMTTLICGIIHEANAREFLFYSTVDTPLVFKSESDGSVTGITPEILDLLMKELNIPYRIVIATTSRTLKDARDGKADMILTISKNKERMEYLLYPEESYVELSWNFFIRKTDEGKIHFQELKDIKGLRVGATKDSSYTPEFWKSDLKLDISTQHTNQISKLLANRFDIVPMPTMLTLYEEKQKGRLNAIAYLPKPLKSKSYYNAFSIASDHPEKKRLISKYDEIIRRMKADGSISRIFNKYLK
ncbi:ABC transporter substrate-binding protein [Desulfopila sp. IMCC35008]|uniref:substrate-binding periplasmic protein n=1 Tax=Desulfopila sp. IMCC35008 TaxID=2653858 RepID=UPI0013D28CB8|nr:transporter substrate-binding domain-containing protein [Desulfopila sp. IMCC35008]